MTAVRLSIACPGGSARNLLDLSRRAAALDLSIWLGDPAGTAPNSDDSYVMATAAAVAATTKDIRIGVWLTLRGSAHALRLAEDIGVVDQISGGRLDLGFVASSAPDGVWRDLVQRMLDSWRSWDVPGGVPVAVTPPPSQLMIPVTVAGDPLLAQQLGAGCAWRSEADGPVVAHRRNIAVVSPDIPGNAIEAWLTHDPAGRIQDLRAAAQAAGNARELVFVVAPDTTDGDLRALAMFVAIGLRSTAGDRDELLDDAWKWLIRDKALHGGFGGGTVLQR